MAIIFGYVAFQFGRLSAEMIEIPSMIADTYTCVCLHTHTHTNTYMHINNTRQQIKWIELEKEIIGCNFGSSKTLAMAYCICTHQRSQSGLLCHFRASRHLAKQSILRWSSLSECINNLGIGGGNCFCNLYLHLAARLKRISDGPEPMARTK